MWRGGCIIRSAFLGDITAGFRADPKMESLLFNDFFIKAVEKAEPGWRRVVAQSVLNGTPIPAFASALTFYDGYRYVVASGL
jgi:6-phosphogluconate dehydrogenase